MQRTLNTASVHVNTCALGTEELIAGFVTATAATSFIQAFAKTIGEEASKSTTRAFGRAGRHSRRLEIEIPDGQALLVPIWPDGLSDESVLALLDLDNPLDDGTFS